jgi:hypothetical protein
LAVGAIARSYARNVYVSNDRWLVAAEVAGLLRSDDGGDTWEPAGHGIDVPMPDMVELFAAAPRRHGVGDLLGRPPAARRTG